MTDKRQDFPPEESTEKKAPPPDSAPIAPPSSHLSPPLQPADIPPARRESFFAMKRPWVNGLLFVLTVASTYFVGLTQSAAYILIDRGGPGADLALTPSILADPAVVSLSLLYVVVLMAILLGH